MSIDNTNLKRIALLELDCEDFKNEIETLKDNVSGLQNFILSLQNSPIIIKHMADTYNSHDYCNECNTSNPTASSAPTCQIADCIYGNSIARSRK